MAALRAAVGKDVGATQYRTRIDTRADGGATQALWADDPIDMASQ